MFLSLMIMLFMCNLLERKNYTLLADVSVSILCFKQ